MTAMHPTSQGSIKTMSTGILLEKNQDAITVVNQDMSRKIAENLSNRTHSIPIPEQAHLPNPQYKSQQLNLHQ
jgi:hypothetical protein